MPWTLKFFSQHLFLFPVSTLGFKLTTVAEKMGHVYFSYLKRNLAIFLWLFPDIIECQHSVALNLSEFWHKTLLKAALLRLSQKKSEKWAASWQNQQNDLCAQQRVRSASVSAQSDQSLRCLHEEPLGPKLTIERPVKTQISLGIRFWSDLVNAQADLSLRWAHSHFLGFVMRQLK